MIDAKLKQVIKQALDIELTEDWIPACRRDKKTIRMWLHIENCSPEFVAAMAEYIVTIHACADMGVRFEDHANNHIRLSEAEKALEKLCQEKEPTK